VSGALSPRGSRVHHRTTGHRARDSDPFNNIIISGVIGGGLAGGSAGVSRRKIGVTLVFWLITLGGASIGIGFGLYKVFAAVLGG